MDCIKTISAELEKRRAELKAMADDIWEYAESGFNEFRSAKRQADYLKKEGFRVTEGLAGEATAFMAEFGSGKPVVAVLGEFDALAGLSQEADTPVCTPAVPGGNGQGCGHNLLGTGSLAAAVAVKECMISEGLKGTVRYYGCPAEENSGGKVYMIRAGLFDDCDVALSWHPWYINKVWDNGSLANYRVLFSFHGTASHAAGAPELGRSALDAVELMDVGVNYMREHMIDEARIHYAIVNSGGTAANVVQAEAEVFYAIRAPKVSQMMELYDRVCDCARGAALMTQTKVDIHQVAAYCDFITNDVIADKLAIHMDELLPLDYTDEELAYASGFTNAISDIQRGDLKEMARKIAGREAGRILSAPMMNFRVKGGIGPCKISTDVGDVSWVVPTAQIYSAVWAPGTPMHSWQAVAQGKSSVALKGMLNAAKILAATACDFLADPSLVEKARKEWLERLDGESYPDPLPEDARPGNW